MHARLSSILNTWMSRFGAGRDAGKAATLAATGQSFEDVEEERVATTGTASPEQQSTDA